MYGQQPYYYQMPQQRIMNPYEAIPQLKGRFVSSFDEAKASQIDFDGSMFVFPDIANRRIYTKQINIDGTALFNVYTLAENVTPQNGSPEYVTKEEFSVTIDEIKNLIESSGGKNAKSAKRSLAANDDLSAF